MVKIPLVCDSGFGVLRLHQTSTGNNEWANSQHKIYNFPPFPYGKNNQMNSSRQNRLLCCAVLLLKRLPCITASTYFISRHDDGSGRARMRGRRFGSSKLNRPARWEQPFGASETQ